MGQVFPVAYSKRFLPSDFGSWYYNPYYISVECTLVAPFQCCGDIIQLTTQSSGVRKHCFADTRTTPLRF